MRTRCLNALNALLGVSLLTLTLTACDVVGSSDGNGVPLTLEMRVGSSASALADPVASARGGALVTVDEVKLLLKTIKFTRVDDDAIRLIALDRLAALENEVGV